MGNPLGARNRVSERFWGEVRSIDYESLWKIGGDTLRVSIRRHTEDPQSYAVVDIYDTVGRRWNKLAFVPYEHMRTMMARPLRRSRTVQEEGLFREDERALLRLADLILGWERKESRIDWEAAAARGFGRPEQVAKSPTAR
jgi:hypothetical protein